MRTITRAAAAVILLVLTLPYAVTATGEHSLESQVDQFLRPILQQDLISGSILIARKGEILLAKGYGPANREYDIPCTPDTKFRLGSVTKQFTAMGVMILSEQGLLSVDDPVSRFYPDYPNGEKITIHHLLTHTSGIVNFNDLEGFDEKYVLPWSVNQVIDWFKDQPLQFEPGERFSYSNSGYVVAAGIIEKLSGKSYEEFLKGRIFVPLGMYGTGMDVHTTVLKNRATGFVSDGQLILQTPYRDMPFMSGAGSLYSTVNDMFLWDQALYTEKLVSKETLDRIFTPYVQTYGYGWFIQDIRGRRLITHRGAINGFLSNIDRFVDDSLVIITLFNFESTFAPDVNRGLAAIALGEEPAPLLMQPPLEVAEEILTTYTGQYQVMPEYVLTVSIDNGALSMEEPDGKRHVAEAQSEDLFFVPGMNAKVKFNKDDSGSINGLIVVQGAHPFRAVKI